MTSQSRQRTSVYWDMFIHPAFGDQPIYVAATEEGLCQITFPHEPFEYLVASVNKRVADAQLVQSMEQLRPYCTQVKEYLEGERKAFTVPVDFRGTEFQNDVWRELVRIPFGETRSYSDIAIAIGRGKAVRAVGAANGANPVPIVVPCHRVIGKNNTLTGFRGGLAIKETLLRLEGAGSYKAKGHQRYLF
ncbi:methylated-DNA--[protein]-cysteine S-methyltransferase [Paenibacillus sp. PAMC21692]|uniref:methylated-DNA--[protein]-cysteine S-methyltransferase n=1 Tax=Paenibacillus sp. PAMC21692 TaxID=2762320 RepID=UPI00164DDF18|nr:methylated-DNA--[protein]-cysteine S-methyltransferase [Paenibacillus sp. PAMC21692]QNK57842.1 methylated-DNA--[protein]-cysteine S-methyltransferase [Paenibacillus sp. PAMC21692]